MKKNIALIAHDGCKTRLIEWASNNKNILREHCLYATRTTGRILERQVNLSMIKFASGPFGGDQQIGARIAQGEIDFLIFFWDPLSTHPHDDDIKALLRLTTLWNIPLACNEATADFLISSPLMSARYKGKKPLVQLQTAVG